MLNTNDNFGNDKLMKEIEQLDDNPAIDSIEEHEKKKRPENLFFMIIIVIIAICGVYVYMTSNGSSVQTLVPVADENTEENSSEKTIETEVDVVDEEAEVRHCAFIRGNAIVGKGAVVGNSTELKNVVLFNKVQVPHYNYVGDSVLGFRAHMGAGSITSNFKSDKSHVFVHGDEDIETGLRKFGAMLGDDVEVGCNSVLNPGIVVCRNSNIYPVSCVRGVVPADSIYKNKTEIIKKY